MDSGTLVLAAWGYGLVGLSYSAFALRLIQLGYLRSAREWSKTTVVAAVTWSALWGWFGLALLLTGMPLFLLFSTLSDLLRYGCWYAFLLILLRPNPAQGRQVGMRWMTPLAAVVVFFGLLALTFSALRISVFGQTSRLIL
ncbi:MAG: PEP-CTERM system histidine kinase PrsK, partial [Polaromonas sp.]|nr:PEP-CTERM system histidine kinase PrsK [Polaromonas sp.]